MNIFCARFRVHGLSQMVGAVRDETERFPAMLWVNSLGNQEPVKLKNDKTNIIDLRGTLTYDNSLSAIRN